MSLCPCVPLSRGPSLPLSLCPSLSLSLSFHGPRGKEKGAVLPFEAWLHTEHMLRAHAEADPALRRTALGSLRGRKEHGRMGPEIGLLKARNGHTTAQIVEKIFPSSPCVLQLDSGFPWDAFLKKKDKLRVMQ